MLIKNEIDIKGGKLTYSQRLDLQKIFSECTSELVIFERVFLCLYNFRPKYKQYKKLIPIFEGVIKGLEFWVERETNLLKYEPSIEEVQAGIKELSKKTGDFGTVKALAKAYNCDPDTILKWEYGKVFGILYTDLEEHKFQKRLHKVYESKFKKAH